MTQASRKNHDIEIPDPPHTPKKPVIDIVPVSYTHLADRAFLWNAVEKIEKAKNAQLAREIEIALPQELTREQGISLVREYVKDQFVNAGMCADIAIHDKQDGNPHAHVMLTMRPIEKDGTWGAKQKKEYILRCV